MLKRIKRWWFVRVRGVRIFQDAECTIPATKDGDPVGAMLNPNEVEHLSYSALLQSDPEKRPICQTWHDNRWQPVHANQIASTTLE